MTNRIRTWNPDKVTKSPNPAKTIAREEQKQGNIAKPKAVRLERQSARDTQKDQTITLPKPKPVK